MFTNFFYFKVERLSSNFSAPVPSTACLVCPFNPISCLMRIFCRKMLKFARESGMFQSVWPRTNYFAMKRQIDWLAWQMTKHTRLPAANCFKQNFLIIFTNIFIFSVLWIVNWIVVFSKFPTGKLAKVSTSLTILKFVAAIIYKRSRMVHLWVT